MARGGLPQHQTRLMPCYTSTVDRHTTTTTLQGASGKKNNSTTHLDVRHPGNSRLPPWQAQPPHEVIKVGEQRRRSARSAAAAVSAPPCRISLAGYRSSLPSLSGRRGGRGRCGRSGGGERFRPSLNRQAGDAQRFTPAQEQTKDSTRKGGERDRDLLRRGKASHGKAACLDDTSMIRDTPKEQTNQETSSDFRRPPTPPYPRHAPETTLLDCGSEVLPTLPLKSERYTHTHDASRNSNPNDTSAVLTLRTS